MSAPKCSICNKTMVKNGKTSAGKPALQAFAGALGRVNKGVFITTSSFIPSAIEFVSSYPHATIVLIDGQKLAELMIRYNLGVTTEQSFELKRIDIDYFEQN